jgi:hypothetical protein
MDALKKYFLLTMAFWGILAGCRKFVQVPDPSNSLGTGTVFSGDANATAALMGMYSRAMTSPGAFLNGGNTIFPALSADECILTQVSPTLQVFSDNMLSSDNLYIFQLYSSAYNTLYNTNVLLENLENSLQVSLPVRRQIMGEAYFVRAFVYSRLVALWGDVPLLTGTNADANAIAPRSSKDSIYGQILQDLHHAGSLLSTDYAWAGTGPADRTRPNRWAASALAAEVLLHMQRWADAEAAASAVIESGAYAMESSVDSVFVKGSLEAIWQLQPVSNSMNSAEGYYYLPLDNAQARPAYVLSPQLLAAFQPGDKRRLQWVGTKTIDGTAYDYPAKYKIRTGPPYGEYNMALRLAAIYLIRAEARAQQGALQAAIDDLDVIRQRAGLAELSPAISRDTVLAAVAQERRVELFAEWGQRWIDLKRWGQADSVLGAEKTGWTADAKLYPFPIKDMERNPALVQNPGY